MDYRSAFQVSATGMAVERLRLEITALNLANMHATTSSPAALYRPLRVVAEQRPLSFERAMQGAAFTQAWSHALPKVSVRPSEATPRLVHEPGHPHADSQGMVAYPGVDHTGEMLNMLTAVRAYEANVAAANASRAMDRSALEIGGQP